MDERKSTAVCVYNNDTLISMPIHENTYIEANKLNITIKNSFVIVCSFLFLPPLKQFIYSRHS